MAADDNSDLFMKFVAHDGTPVAGETRAQVNFSTSRMAKDFKQNEMFEVLRFTFATELGEEGETEAASDANQAAGTIDDTNRALRDIAARAGVRMPGGIRRPRRPARKHGANTPPSYSVDIKPMEFQRAIDISSPVMMKHFIEQRVFKSATLIKRKAAGGKASGEPFFRFDFDTVLITDISWEHEEPVRETYHFVCRAVTINYLPSNPDGSLGAPIQAFWTAVPGKTARRV